MKSPVKTTITNNSVNRLILAAYQVPFTLSSVGQAGSVKVFGYDLLTALSSAQSISLQAMHKSGKITIRYNIEAGYLGDEVVAADNAATSAPAPVLTDSVGAVPEVKSRVPDTLKMAKTMVSVVKGPDESTTDASGISIVDTGADVKSTEAPADYSFQGKPVEVTGMTGMMQAANARAQAARAESAAKAQSTEATMQAQADAAKASREAAAEVVAPKAVPAPAVKAVAVPAAPKAAVPKAPTAKPAAKPATQTKAPATAANRNTKL